MMDMCSVNCKVPYVCIYSFIQILMKYQNHRMLELEEIVEDQKAQFLYFKDEEADT